MHTYHLTGQTLPCLDSSKGNRRRPRQSNHFKSHFVLAGNIAALIEGCGIENVIFVTLTLAHAGLSIAEVRRRWKSFRTGVLGRYYKRWLCVAGCGRNGRQHFHILAETQEDIRSGLSKYDLRKQQSPLANAALRQQWSFWSGVAERYNFGRVEAMPIRTPLGLNRYLCKHLRWRPSKLFGSRLARYSQNWRSHFMKVSFYSGKAREFREAARLYFHPLSFDDVRRIFGRYWAWKLYPQFQEDHLEP